MDLTQKFDKGL